MKLSLKFVYFLNIIAAVGSAFAYLSPYVKPSITGLFSYVGLGFPMLIICHLIFLVFWLFTKPKKMFLSLLILIIGYVPFNKTIGLSNNFIDQSGLNILSYNIGYTRLHLSGKNKKAKKQQFVSFVKNQNPEIICLQEMAINQDKIYKDIFKGYQLHTVDQIRTGIYTKLPIVNKGNISFDTKAHNATWIDVKYKKKTVRVYSVHLSSNKVKNFTDNIKEIWGQSLYILDKYNEHAQIRVKQVKKILAHAEKSPHPVVITGDFNDIPQSYIYKLMAYNYKDVFVEKGSGLGKTFMTNLPGLRIDYAFISKDLETKSHTILKEKLSDHYPILTSVDFKNDVD